MYDRNRQAKANMRASLPVLWMAATYFQSASFSSDHSRQIHSLRKGHWSCEYLALIRDNAHGLEPFHSRNSKKGPGSPFQMLRLRGGKGLGMNQSDFEDFLWSKDIQQQGIDPLFMEVTSCSTFLNPTLSLSKKQYAPQQSQMPILSTARGRRGLMVQGAMKILASFIKPHPRHTIHIRKMLILILSSRH